MTQPRFAPYKGTRDFYPADKRRLDQLLATVASVAESYGYEPYDGPLIEPLDLYRLKSQTNPEIVSQQIYSFTDKSGRQLAIRPEMTPSAARMVAARQSVLQYPLRWYSWPRLWRYEQPQRGRLREHFQFNVDLFGEPGLAAEFELICLAAAIFDRFGAGPETYRFDLSSRSLMSDFLSNCLQLTPDQALATFGLIDRWVKDPAGCRQQFSDLLTVEQNRQGMADRLESLLAIDDLDQLPAEAQAGQAFADLKRLLADLAAAGLTNCRFNPGIVRGFDYYTGIVFEAFDCHPDNNRSLLGGGRYDRLVESIGGQACPTVGFGLGDATLANFLDSHGLMPTVPEPVDALVALIDLPYATAQPTIEAWRRAGLNLVVEMTDRRLGKKIALADKRGIPYVIIFGADELASGKFNCRLLSSGQEVSLTVDELADQLKQSAQPPERSV